MCCSYASYLQLLTLPFRISERQSQRSYILTCLRYTTRVREEMKMVALQSCCAETRRFLLTPFEVSSRRKAVSTVWTQYEHVPFLVGTLSFLKGSLIRLDLLKFQYSSWTVNIRNRRGSSTFLEVRNFSHQFLINFFEKYLSCHLLSFRDTE